MAKLLDDTALGPRPEPRPDGGLAQYRGEVPNLEAPAQAAMAVGSELAQFFAVEQEKADTTRVEDAWNKYKEAALEVTNGPDGVLNKRGGDAVNGNILQSAQKRLEDARTAIEGSLANDEQRQRFKLRAQSTNLQVKHETLKHLDTEGKVYATSVIMGSEAAARQQIAAMPESQDVFTQAQDTLMRQADVYLKGQGVTDPNAIKAYKDKVNDGLWNTRIDALLYSKPLLADGLFRANQDQIKNPELRLQLQAKTREVATGVQATTEAAKIVDEVRQSPVLTRPGGIFGTAVTSLIAREGGYNPSDGKSGAPVKFGINQKANPDVDVKNLTQEKAAEIYKTRYWDKIGGDSLPPATALVALDTAALQGVEVAKELLKTTGGDPQAMIAARRTQLQALAARDPEQRPYLASWMRRLDGLQAEAEGMPQGPVPPSTSGMPTSRDISAQLPFMLQRVEKTADRIYGPDTQNPDRAAFVKRLTAEIHSKVAADVQQLNSLQRQAQGVLIDAITGVGAPPAAGGMTAAGGGRAGTPGQVITSFSQIQANPTLLAAWQQTDAQAKLGLERLIEFNQRADQKGNEELYWDTWKRIHLEPGDPKKIDFYKQIVDLAGPGKLTTQMVSQLRLEIDRAETPGGRSINQMRKAADSQVAAYFKTNVMFTAQPERQIAATMRWNEDVGKKVDEYVAAGKDVRSLFLLDSKDSVVSPAYLQSYVNSTPATGVAAGAAAVREGQAPALAPVRQPDTIKTRAELDAWLQTLPAGQTTFMGTDGKTYKVPPRAAVPADQLRADGTVKGPGFLGPLPFKDGRQSTEISIGVEFDGKKMEIPTLVPTLTKPEIESLLKGERPSDAIVEKAVAHARQRLKDGKPVFAQPGEAPAAAPAMVMDQTGKLVPAAPPVPAPAAAPAKPKDALPAFNAQPGMSEAERSMHRGALIEAAKAIAGVPIDVARGTMGVYLDIGEWLRSVPKRNREALARGAFEAVLKKDSFTEQDIPAIEGALKYADLNPWEKKKAKALLKAAGR